MYDQHFLKTQIIDQFPLTMGKNNDYFMYIPLQLVTWRLQDDFLVGRQAQMRVITSQGPLTNRIKPSGIWLLIISTCRFPWLDLDPTSSYLS